MAGSTAPLEDDRPEGRRPPARGVDLEDLFGRRRTPAAALPDPGPLVRNLARCAVEVVAGARDPEQLARWLEPDVHAQLVRRAVIAARARHATGRRVALPTVTIGSCRIDQAAEDAVEAAVVVHSRPRVRAVVMRLIGVDGRWRAAALSVL